MSIDEKKQYILDKFAKNTTFDKRAFEEATDEEIDGIFNELVDYARLRGFKNPLYANKKSTNCTPSTPFGKWFIANFFPMCEDRPFYNKLRKRFNKGLIDLNKSAKEQGLEKRKESE